MTQGYKTGGRVRGTPNKETVIRLERQAEASRRLAELMGTEVFPGDSLELFQSVYKNMTMPLPTRMEAAAKALPYERRKLPTDIEVTQDTGPKIQIAHFTRVLDTPIIDAELVASELLSDTHKSDGDNNITPLIVGPEDKGPEQD